MNNKYFCSNYLDMGNKTYHFEINLVIVLIRYLFYLRPKFAPALRFVYSDHYRYICLFVHL